MPMKFRFRTIPFIAALMVAAIGFALGQWQTRRAVEKEMMEATMLARESAPPLVLNGTLHASEEVEYRRVRVRGQFVRDWSVYLDNRPYNGTAGFHVLMPMKISGSDMHVLVARGWARRDVSDRTRLPPIATSDDVVEIEGIARSHTARVLQLGDAGPLRPNAIVQNADVATFEQAGKWQMQPFIIEQTTDLQDGLIRDWPRPSTGVEKHRGYAFQWYALAATALIFFVVTGFRRGSK
jgi:surfeit locus 1 family protein